MNPKQKKIAIIAAAVLLLAAAIAVVLALPKGEKGSLTMPQFPEQTKEEHIEPAVGTSAEEVLEGEALPLEEVQEEQPQPTAQATAAVTAEPTQTAATTAATNPTATPKATALPDTEDAGASETQQTGDGSSLD